MVVKKNKNKNLSKLINLKSLLPDVDGGVCGLGADAPWCDR